MGPSIQKQPRWHLHKASERHDAHALTAWIDPLVAYVLFSICVVHGCANNLHPILSNPNQGRPTILRNSPIFTCCRFSGFPEFRLGCVRVALPILAASHAIARAL